MKFEIKNRWDGSILFAIKTDSWKSAIEAALNVKSDLSEANLSMANLSEANLSRANLARADLEFIRDDIWAVLSSSPKEVAGLRQALIDGKVDGSTYVGDCACLVGTIANVRKCSIDELPILKKNPTRAAERFFMGIKKGDKPKTNQVSKLALQWVDEWLENMKAAFAK